jgi:MFS family permease
LTLQLYRQILRVPGVGRLLAGVLLNGMWAAIPLAIILAVRHAHSFSAAGVAAAVFAVCAGLSNPVRGRAVDRFGPTRSLLVLAAWRAAALAGLALAIGAGAGVPVLCALAGAAGTANPPVASVLRSMWRALVGEERMNAGYALQSMLNEVAYVFWPVVVGVLAATAGPVWAIAAAASVELAGTLLFLTVPLVRSWREEAHAQGLLGALRAPGFRMLAIVNVPFGMAFGAFDVAAPALALQQDAGWATGVAMAALAVGSILGGLGYGARRWRAPAPRRFLFLLLALSVGFLPVAFASSVPALIALAGIAGLAVAPTIATVFGLIDDVAPTGTGTEAMTWILALYALGTAAGAAGAGFLAADHLRLALCGPAACAALAALLAWLGAQRLSGIASPTGSSGSASTASSVAE